MATPLCAHVTDGGPRAHCKHIPCDAPRGKHEAVITTFVDSIELHVVAQLCTSCMLAMGAGERPAVTLAP